jgi:hypothetical protein
MGVTLQVKKWVIKTPIKKIMSIFYEGPFVLLGTSFHLKRVGEGS